MGQRRLATPQGDDRAKRPQPKKADTAAMNNTSTRKGEVFRAQRRTNETVNMQASQHKISVPVNKSIYNGYGGNQFSLAEQKRMKKPQQPVLRVIPIGGLGEMGIGKNMMAIEYDNDIIVIDMGFLFPGADYPGINYITPDISWLKERKHKIRGHIFTHGHLDHIGSFRHFIPEIPAPVYASKFTVGMLKKNMEESTSDYEPEYNVLDPHSYQPVQLGDSFSVELVRVNHSIPDATAVVIRTPVGVLVDTGDWRFENNPIDGEKFDLPRLTEISQKEGILLLMSDSTNCESQGTNTEVSEFDIKDSVENVMRDYPNGRIIMSSFSSQIHRIQLMLEAAKNNGRKVAFAGSSMITNLEVALRNGTIKVPKDTIVKMEQLAHLPDNQVAIICTGSQGEFNAVLNRMATGAHKHIKIKRSDVVVFSSNPIPGNEKYVVRTVDGLMREGSSVIQNGKSHLTGVGPLHISGHGYYEDHVTLINALNPKYYLPIHGEFHMLAHNAELAVNACGMSSDNVFVSDSGDIHEFLHDGTARKAGRIPVGGDMYDDSGAIVSEVVLKDRIHMSQEGMFVVVLTVQKGTGRLLASPDIISRGFIYLRDSEELMNTIRQYLRQKASRMYAGGRVDLDTFKKELRDEITHLLYDQTRRTPIVIPVVNEIGGSAKPQNGSVQPAAQAQQSKPTQFKKPAPKKFPPRQAPDSEATARRPMTERDNRGY